LANGSNHDEVAYFESVLGKQGYYNFSVLGAYISYLQLAQKNVQQSAIPGLKAYYKNSNDEIVGSYMPTLVNSLKGAWKEKINNLEKEKISQKKNPDAVKNIEEKIEEAKQMIAAYDSILE
jgi:hypothetical protein